MESDVFGYFCILLEKVSKLRHEDVSIDCGLIHRIISTYMSMVSHEDTKYAVLFHQHI